ncbi:pirin [Emticicia sp. BO119]|uniref:pirin family protein n=1 Tax=Emticicia sp. BO119 TaxID=2757768 RepID=UPI0015F07C7F|nr:pirin [Emticicia sp. BO119]MBA4853487.1 pirin [Emticicia sp. BO119]
MLTQTEGQIYLSNLRGITNRKIFRSFHTFNHGSYSDESKKPFGNLIACNDDTLAAGNAIITNVDKALEIFIIPIVGGIEVKDNKDQKFFLDAGETLILKLSKGDYYQVSNPFKDELVNFLQIWIENDPVSINLTNRQISFDLDGNKNQLKTIGDKCYIGKFSGREEGGLTINDRDKGVFGFVVEGAFEFQNRLVETRDGIALWNEDNEALQIEFEALSNNAIILIVEVAIKDGNSF